LRRKIIFYFGMYGAAGEREREGERERRKMRVSWMMGVGVLIGYFSPHLI
jgi:hypothetical protein